MNVVKCLPLVVAAWTPLFAGQSWVTGNSTGAQTASNSSVPPVNIPFCKAISWDVVPQLLTTVYFIAGNPFIGTALPLSIEAIPAGSGIQMAVNFAGETGVSGGGVALGGFQINGSAGNALLGWICHDIAAYGGTNTDYVALYDINGNTVAQASQTYVSIAPITSSGWQISGGNGSDAFHVAFERICTGEAAIPLWKTIPKTFGGCPLGTELLEWKFDGTLADSSGNGYTASISGPGGTTPTYAPSLHQGVVPIIKTANPPLWSYIVPMRAGNANQLDCTASFSQSDVSNSVTCFWQVLSGPSVPTFDSRTAYQPTLTGLVFGDYLVQLTATDLAGDRGSATADIGAVPTDSNGVVVQTTPNADLVYGPMIALGKNPWGLQDSESQQMIGLQFTYQGCCTPPTWATSGQGTIGYEFCGVGGCSGAGTSTGAAMTATSQTVVVNNASLLDLSSLPSVPTTIIVDSELMLICSTTGTTGVQTLTVCYNGRGIQGGGLYASIATAHALNANVGQFKITGTSTLFTSDPITPLCPSAVTVGLGSALPSPLGRVIYSAGQATMTPGSATMVASGGASWTNANGIYPSNGLFVLVAGTHAGGTPFSFIAQITSLPDSSHIGLAVPYPSDADSGTFNYAVVSYRYASLEYTRLDGSTGRTLQNALQVCIGDLQLGGLAGHDYGYPINLLSFSGQHYAFKDNLGIVGAYGPNFYGTGLAARAVYLRSGYAKDLQLANFVDDYWARDPELDGGYVGAEPLLEGGGFIGAVADAVTNPNNLVSTGCVAGNPLCNVRGFAKQAEQLISIGCDGDDTRDTGYERAIIALMAKFDSPGITTSTTASSGSTTLTVGSSAGIYVGQLVTIAGVQPGTFVVYPVSGTTVHISLPTTSTVSGTASFGFQQRWIYDLESIYNQHDVGGNACKQTDNSFANAFLLDTNGATPNVPNSGWAPLHLTNGSAIATDATGLGITPDRCAIAASGTLSVTNGSGVATDSANNLINPNPGNYGRRLIIHGTKNSGTTPYIGIFSYLYNSSSSITLNGQWPGDTGSFTYVIEDVGQPTTIGTSQADHANLTQAWACTWNSSSQITLDRPWTGTSGVYNLYQSPGRNLYGYAIGGYGQQPYMLGIAVTGLSFASQAGDGSYDSLWKTLSQSAATWLWTPGNGYDPFSQGVNYGAIYGGCDLKVPVSTTVGFILGNSQGNGDWCQVDRLPNGGINTARGISAETLGSLTQYYRSNPGPTLKALGDTVYGSTFASLVLTTGGVYTPADNNPGSNQYFAAYKWPGFYFGMGMSHQWPATRLGGVLPAVNRTLLIGICLGSGCSGSVPNATNVDVVLTAPNDLVVTTNCTSSPCSATADARQGNYLLVLKYKSAGGKVLAQTDPQILTIQ
jgi:hypothetical protein